MQISEEDRKILQNYSNKPDEDNVRYKKIIKEKLLKNNRIIYLLHDEELEKANSKNDDYFGVCILPYYLIAPVQHEVRHYICYECSFNRESLYNSIIKAQTIIFYVLVEQKDILINQDGISAARHDLLTAEIINEFNGCNDFGNQLKLISCKPSTTDTNYATYTIVFEQLTPNSITKYGEKSFNLRK